MNLLYEKLGIDSFSKVNNNLFSFEQRVDEVRRRYYK
jgi:hypothetical protein